VDERVQAAEQAVGTALGAIIVGGAAGGLLLCVVLALAHGMRGTADATFARLAIGAALSGLAVAALVGGALARRLGVWRSAVSAMVALAGAALVGVLTTAADMAAGALGLVGLASLCVAAMAGAWRIFYAGDKR